MEMCDALMIGGTQHWGGGDDIFGIGIAYGLQGSEGQVTGHCPVR